jgi:hypothetical protein
VPLSALFCPVPKKIPMFDRVELEPVRISKVAVKLNFPFSMHWFVPTIPPWYTFTVLDSTPAVFTSLAVQLFALLTSAKQLFCANAGAARMTSASSARTNETFLQHVRELIAFLLLRRNRALVGCCLVSDFQFLKALCWQTCDWAWHDRGKCDRALEGWIGYGWGADGKG